MKILERGFSKRETVLFLVLVALLLTLAYIQFVDRPVRSAIETAKAEQESLLTELDAVNSRAARLEEMQQELDGMDSTRHQSIMGSYNNEKEELEILNSILQNAGTYSISFYGITREGDLVRRNFSLEFTAGSMDAVGSILSSLADSPYRCLIGDINVREGVVGNEAGYTVQAEATFYETMEGGTEDAGLPQETLE